MSIVRTDTCPMRSSLAFVERPEEMPERPVGDVLALVAGRLVCRAEVDALIDAGVDNVVSRVRQPMIGARLLNDLRDVACECKGQSIRSEEMMQHTGNRAVKTICSGRVFRISRGHD